MADHIKLVEREAFVTAAKDGATEGLAIRKAFSAEMKAFDPLARTIDFIISTAAVDRSKDSVAVSGWDYDAYMKSPVVLWCHDSSQPPVGKALSVSKTAGSLQSRAQFMSRDLSPFADTIFRMYQEKYLSAVSVGFIPKSYSFSSEKGREFGVDFKSQELLEYSCCPVPANPEALIAAKSAGIDTSPISEWASKVLDEGGHILIPRNILEDAFRQAKTPRVIRQKYLDKSNSPVKSEADWKVGGASDLPIDESDAWDGAAAAKRMLDAAGFDGDNPDTAKAARGFLIHDAANPGLRDSYKMPFADLFGGELRAVQLGIIAAKDAATKEKTNKSDAPAILDDALAIITGYQAKAITSKLMTLEQFRDSVSTAPIAIGDEIIISPTEKSGRRISNANTALLQKAMEHHDSATQCLKDVLASNTPDDDPEDTAPDDQVDPPVVVVTLDARAERLKEARALRASAKI